MTRGWGHFRPGPSLRALVGPDQIVIPDHTADIALGDRLKAIAGRSDDELAVLRCVIDVLLPQAAAALTADISYEDQRRGLRPSISVRRRERKL